ncbi:vacuolar protein sorting-associated protein 55 homolog isoform X2 [Selaginella moellendorffii]|uniref:vacuolar protein sorting-associated protein 55 homolog isoform X2 n=1 Tax=Selaginella moellendorffii TaxID=88036 RepID=UPI000D1C8D86|nr:vacuolar protein sorting-associated protein 55 homolog isoform X2 [Selaginella moellendorffii]XP_024528323.1 vacuolar protein sorting-associated protein 55 homolog isoform X2 [Selaginella moellendorffii]|eukprot:XP_024522009.1 vacuolar protein sorting-associated protein 55 homolog isoform X2 [Selaginella moellendorffii]
MAIDSASPRAVLAGLAFMFSVGIMMQILACALYSNWWPMLTALMYVMVPMPCLFFGSSSSESLLSVGDATGDWADAAKFLTGFSTVGSIAIPAILRHAMLIEIGAMFLAYSSFIILTSTVILFQYVTRESEW